MKTQTVVGLIFLALGLVLVGVVLAPAVAALRAHAPAATIALVPLCVGIGVAVFGALVIPSSGAGQAVKDLLAAVVAAKQGGVAP